VACLLDFDFGFCAAQTTPAQNRKAPSAQGTRNDRFIISLATGKSEKPGGLASCHESYSVLDQPATIVVATNSKIPWVKLQHRNKVPADH